MASSLSRRRGFTYMELVIVILIMGILTAVAVPRVRELRNRYGVDAAARRLALDLGLARQHARTRGADQTVEFQATPSSQYTLPGMRNSVSPLRDYQTDLRADYGAWVVADVTGAQVVPAPSAVLLVGSGLGLLATRRRRPRVTG